MNQPFSPKILLFGLLLSFMWAEGIHAQQLMSHGGCYWEVPGDFLHTDEVGYVVRVDIYGEHQSITFGEGYDYEALSGDGVMEIQRSSLEGLEVFSYVYVNPSTRDGESWTVVDVVSGLEFLRFWNMKLTDVLDMFVKCD